MAHYGPEALSLPAGGCLVLRHIVASDAETALAFRRQVAAETTHTMLYPGMSLPSKEALGERYEREVPDPLTLNLGAFEGERLVAHLNFRPVVGSHPWMAHAAAFGMMVLRDFWGQGVARALLAAQDAHARRCSVTRIEATVRTENSRGVRLYEKAGFTIEGTRRRAVRIDGRYGDEYFIAKHLD